jgi:hypothetical protein
MTVTMEMRNRWEREPMRRTKTALAILTGALTTVAAVAAPTAAVADDGVQPLISTACRFGNTWVVTGNWDGIGGDGIGVVMARNGQLEWHLRNTATNGADEYTFPYGLNSDLPVVGNWDGAGGDTPGIVRQNGTEWQWHIRNTLTSGNALTPFNYGNADYYWPLTGNWDGVGGDGVGAAGGDANGSKAWHLRNAAGPGNADYNFPYGNAGGTNDVPITGNWDGAGGDGPGILRILPNGAYEWNLRDALSAGPGRAFPYGQNGDCPVVGNWDSAGGDGIGVVRNEGGVLKWYLRDSSTAGTHNYLVSYGSPT